MNGLIFEYNVKIVQYHAHHSLIKAKNWLITHQGFRNNYK